MTHGLVGLIAQSNALSLPILMEKLKVRKCLCTSSFRHQKADLQTSHPLEYSEQHVSILMFDFTQQ